MAGRILFAGAVMGALAVGALGGTYVAAANLAGQPSAKVSWEEAKLNPGDWGEMRLFFTGETFATKNMYTALATVRPGKAVHEAHQHAEEEFMLLVKGSGEWHLDGQNFAAKEGDILYVQPWVMHGLVNSSQEDLVFLVIKYLGKGVPPPDAPAPPA